ncbi:MAG: hypothetical protein ACO1RT_01080 [Planctomycetaceae bacterium]
MTTLPDARTLTTDRPTTAGSSYGSPKRRSSKDAPGGLRKSRFDSVSSLLLSLLVIIGIAVFMLFIVWWDSRVRLPMKTLEMLIENPAGRGDNAEGFERDFEPPGAEEVEALAEPTMQDTIAAVTDAVSSVAATIDSVNSNASATTTGTGKGDSRPPGPEGEGEDVIPRSERWQLNFSAKNLAAYAQQLDYYKIELGAIGGSQIQGVDYASGLAGTPKIRRGKSEAEKRLYFMWTTPSPLEKYDRQLLQKAGIPLPGRQMLKFLEPDLENLLANIEKEYATKNGHPSVTEIAKTVFESQPTSNGYEFVVTEQRYRKPKR